MSMPGIENFGQTADVPSTFRSTRARELSVLFKRVKRLRARRLGSEKLILFAARVAFYRLGKRRMRQLQLSQSMRKTLIRLPSLLRSSPKKNTTDRRTGGHPRGRPGEGFQIEPGPDQARGTGSS